MIKKDNKKSPKNSLKYNCKFCHYNTDNKKDYEKHCNTEKHKIAIMITNDNKNIKKSHDDNCKHVCLICGKSYKYKSGLSRHKLKCIPITEILNDEQLNNDDIATLQQTNELVINMLKETTITNNKLYEKIAELENKQPIQNNNITNQNFNINVFLNTECKNAMNLDDFMQKLNLTMEDLIYTKNNGFIKGVAKIFVKNLEELKITDRPIHCSDKKNNLIYVKNENSWKEDLKYENIDKSIDNVAKKQIQIIKKWEEEHPGWNNNDKGIEEYMLMLQGIMGSSSELEREKDRTKIRREIFNTMELPFTDLKN